PQDRRAFHPIGARQPHLNRPMPAMLAFETHEFNDWIIKLPLERFELNLIQRGVWNQVSPARARLKSANSGDRPCQSECSNHQRAIIASWADLRELPVAFET